LIDALGEGASGRRGAAEKVGEREGDGPRISLSSDFDTSDPDTARASLHHPADGPPQETGWSPARKVRFLHQLAEKGDVRAAASRVGMSRQSAYLLRRRDTAFARGWDAALGLARRHVEEVLATRALDGVEEPVFYHGEQVAVRRRYDARLLLAHLARLDRAVESAPGGGETVGELAERFDEVLAVVAGEGPEALLAVSAGRATLPPAREVYAEKAGALLQREADLAWEEAVEAGEAGPEDEPDPYVVVWREAAAGDWDGWRRRAEGAVDAVLAEEGAPPMEFKSLAGGPEWRGPKWREDVFYAQDRVKRVKRGAAGNPMRGAMLSWVKVGAVLPPPPPLPRRPSLFRDLRGLFVFGEDGEFDFAGAHAGDADFLRGGLGEVDHAVGVERAAVVDADHDGIAGQRVGDAQLGAEGQRGMGGGEVVRVEALAAGGAGSPERVAVEAGGAALDVFEFLRVLVERLGQGGDGRGSCGRGDDRGGRGCLGLCGRQLRLGDRRGGRSYQHGSGGKSKADARKSLGFMRLVVLPRHGEDSYRQFVAVGTHAKAARRTLATGRRMSLRR